MQVEMVNGKSLEDVADSTSHEADFDGMSGSVYNLVVSMLSRYWKHGEKLRRWNNLEAQIGNEGEQANALGGVLNSSLLLVG